MASKKFGDSSKLPENKQSFRAKRATLREDPPNTYAKGGSVKKAKGGSIDGAAIKGLTKAP